MPFLPSICVSHLICHYPFIYLLVMPWLRRLIAGLSAISLSSIRGQCLWDMWLSQWLSILICSRRCVVLKLTAYLDKTLFSFYSSLYKESLCHNGSRNFWPNIPRIPLLVSNSRVLDNWHPRLKLTPNHQPRKSTYFLGRSLFKLEKATVTTAPAESRHGLKFRIWFVSESHALRIRTITAYSNPVFCGAWI